MSGETPSDDDKNYYFVCKVGENQNYEPPEGPNGLIAQAHNDETIKPFWESGEVELQMVAPYTSFGLMISRRVADTVLKVLREKGMHVENRGYDDFPN